MSKVLKIVSPEKCIGCELCVGEAQRQLKKLGPEGAYIHIFRQGTGFKIVLDPQVNTLDVDAIKSICPREVYETFEVEDNELL